MTVPSRGVFFQPVIGVEIYPALNIFNIREKLQQFMTLVHTGVVHLCSAFGYSNYNNKTSSELDACKDSADLVS